jgi:3-isopropylmalate/(R)-2-methylmalate dehydratase small subunit
VADGVVEGRTWVFPDANLNTDLIMPAAAFRLPREEQVKLVFSANRPGWVDEVTPGDILIAGRNFGTGSSRPGAELFRRLGIAGLVAESINDLFYRNCVNYALPVLECAGIVRSVTEGDRVRLDIGSGTVTNLNSGLVLHGAPMPSLLREIIAAGGLFEKLRAEGYI